MADCTCNPEYLLSAAERAISPREAAIGFAELHAIAPNPFEQGRKNQEEMWMRSWTKHARKLVWC